MSLEHQILVTVSCFKSKNVLRKQVFRTVCVSLSALVTTRQEKINPMDCDANLLPHKSCQ